jgi:SNF2 family DNA or RNA helicase
MRQIGTFKWVERPEAIDIVHEVMQPAVRFTREQCFDLPPTTYTTLQVALDPAAQKAYKDMLEELHTEVRNHEITAANEGVKLSKLLQISAGFGYSEGGTGHYIGGVDRFKTIFELIEGSQGKVIVFASFRYMVEMLAGVLGKRYQVGMIHGDVPKAQRDLIFANFQKESTRVLVAHPQCCAHGLTLTAANTTIWATPTTSNEIYEQANARITRAGQTQNTHIIHLASTKAESQVYQRLKTKQRMQGALLDLFAAQTNDDLANRKPR